MAGKNSFLKKISNAFQAADAGRESLTEDEKNALRRAGDIKKEMKAALGRDLTDDEANAIEQSVPGAWEARKKSSDAMEATLRKTKETSVKIQ